MWVLPLQLYQHRMTQQLTREWSLRFKWVPSLKKSPFKILSPNDGRRRWYWSVLKPGMRKNPGIHRDRTVEESISHLQCAKKRLKKKSGKSPQNKGYNKDAGKSKVQVHECVEFKVSWLKLGRMNESLIQAHQLIWLEPSHRSRTTEKLQRLLLPLQMEIFYLIFTGVLHVPGLHRNFISVGRWLFGAHCDLSQAKEIRCSKIVQRTCQASLELNRQIDQLSEMWLCQRLPELRFQSLSQCRRYSFAKYSELASSVLYPPELYSTQGRWICPQWCRNTRILTVLYPTKFSGAAMNATDCTSSMVLEEMVYGVSWDRTYLTWGHHLRMRVEGIQWSN